MIHTYKQSCQACTPEYSQSQCCTVAHMPAPFQVYMELYRKGHRHINDT